MKICPYCGMEEYDSNICSVCGRDLSDVEDVAEDEILVTDEVANEVVDSNDSADCEQVEECGTQYDAVEVVEDEVSEECDTKAENIQEDTEKSGKTKKEKKKFKLFDTHQNDDDVVDKKTLKKRRIIGVCVFAAIVCLQLMAVLVVKVVIPAVDAGKPFKQYEDITLGMTYDQVVETLGKQDPTIYDGLGPNSSWHGTTQFVYIKKNSKTEELIKCENMKIALEESIEKILNKEEPTEEDFEILARKQEYLQNCEDKLVTLNATVKDYERLEIYFDINGKVDGVRYDKKYDPYRYTDKDVKEITGIPASINKYSDEEYTVTIYYKDKSYQLYNIRPFDYYLSYSNYKYEIHWSDDWGSYSREVKIDNSIQAGAIIRGKANDTIDYELKALSDGEVGSQDNQPTFELTLSGVGALEVVESNGGYPWDKKGTITSIVIEDGITSIGGSTFRGYSQLEKVVIGNDVRIIEGSAFAYCGRLTTVVLGSNIKEIWGEAFKYCSSLEKIYYQGSESDWYSVTVGPYNNEFRAATLYYYSETAPTEEGNYWHYVDGVITEWTK